MENNLAKPGDLIAHFQKRNIAGFFLRDKVSAVKKILEIIPREATVGISGSQTLNQLGLVHSLNARGTLVYDQYQPGLSPQESEELRAKGVCADYYLSSANAISAKGELVFFSARGHRIAGIANAKRVLIVAGTNKITTDVEQGIRRAREYATPLNCKRLHYATPCVQDGRCHNDSCLFPEYKRMCCQLLVLEAESIPGRMTVVLVDEEMGY